MIPPFYMALLFWTGVSILAHALHRRIRARETPEEAILRARVEKRAIDDWRRAHLGWPPDEPALPDPSAPRDPAHPYRAPFADGETPPPWTPEREMATRAEGARAELAEVLRITRGMVEIEADLRRRGGETQALMAILLVVLEDRQAPAPAAPVPPIGEGDILSS